VHEAMSGASGIAGVGSRHLRVLRGGAFNNNRNNLRCAYRNRNNPNNRNNDIGFRVVLSTFVWLPEMSGGVFHPSVPRQMAEPVPGRVPMNILGRANSSGPISWIES